MPPNIKVFRVHRLLAVLYGGLGILLFAGVAFAGRNGSVLGALPLLVVFGGISAVHAFTASACRKGRQGGRTASMVIACLMLLGFPIGTLIGGYLLYNSGGWPKPGEPLDRAAALDF